MGRYIAGRIAPLQPVVQLLRAVLDHLDIQRLSNHAGRRHQHVLRSAANDRRCGLAHPPGVLLAAGCAGVGVAAVGNDRPGPAVRQMGFRDVDGRGLYDVLRKHSRRRAVRIGYDQRHVFFIHIVGLHAHMEPRRPKALGRAHSSGNLFQHGFLPLCISLVFKYSVPPSRRSPASGSCSAPPHRTRPSPGCQRGP